MLYYIATYTTVYIDNLFLITNVVYVFYHTDSQR